MKLGFSLGDSRGTRGGPTGQLSSAAGTANKRSEAATRNEAVRLRRKHVCCMLGLVCWRRLWKHGLCCSTSGIGDRICSEDCTFQDRVKRMECSALQTFEGYTCTVSSCRVPVVWQGRSTECCTAA
jgi:hypothetical protein